PFPLIFSAQRATDSALHREEVSMRLRQVSTSLNRSSLKTNQESPPIYKGHSHFAERALSRRAFLGMTAAASGLAIAGLAAPPLAHAAKESHLPKPIPGGLQLLGPGPALPFVSSRPYE